MLIIYLPRFDERSGGLRMYWRLPRLIRAAGFDCCATEGQCDVKPGDIVVYPDCVRDNPLNASQVVRYFCAPASWSDNGFFGGGRVPATELAIPYDHWLFDDVQAHYDGALGTPLKFPCIEDGLFYPEQKTIENLVYIGKQHCKVMPAVDNPTILGRISHSREQAVPMIRRARNVYSLDHWTILMDEAILSGCNAFYVHGETDFRRYENADAEKSIMNAARDMETARAFAERCLAFFPPAA